MNCVVCDGRGCDECGRIGTIDIAECPLLLITPDIWEVMEYAEFYEKGLPPVVGGALDQSYSFIQACRYIWGIENYIKKKLGWFD